MMKRLYLKNRLNFALVWIGLYVVLVSLADGISKALGIQKLITAPLCIGMTIFLWVWIRRNALMEKYGLCRFRGSARAYLYFLPLALICSTNLWRGLGLSMSVPETLLYILSMLCVGFLEEVIFRGFLLRALQEQGARYAILISGLTFGLGHVVNLLGGAEFLPTLLQICYAAAIGLLFAIIFVKGGSLWPCIIAHSVINSLSAVAAESSAAMDIWIGCVLMAAPIAYAVWIWKRASSN